MLDGTRWGSEPGGEGATAPAALLARLLDEVDFGMLLVAEDGSLRFGNQLGRNELGGGGALQLEGGKVHACRSKDQPTLLSALHDARRGRWRMFNLEVDDGVMQFFAVPMSDAADLRAGLALLLFGQRSTAESLTVDFFAQKYALTGAETQVLKSLCRGLDPRDIAAHQHVKISTIRSQICSIRVKTQCGSIRELLGRVWSLPPIRPRMRPAAAGLGPAAVC